RHSGERGGAESGADRLVPVSTLQAPPGSDRHAWCCFHVAARVRCNREMRRRKRQDADVVGEDVEAAVRATAASIQRRLDEYPEPNALTCDSEFVATSLQLAEAGVPFATVERLG